MSFKVFSGDRPLDVKEEAIEWESSAQGFLVTIPVEAQPDREIGEGPDGGDEAEGFTVSGTVLHTDGTAVVGVTVHAYHLALGSERALGSATTGAGGTYRIVYGFAAGAPDLFVRALDGEGEELAVSTVRYAASEEETIDLAVEDERYRGASEFAQVDEALSPHLEDVDLSGLDTEDVALLVEKTGVEREHVGKYVAAARLAERTGLSHEAIYGLLRVGSPASPGSLLAQSRSRVKGALVAAAEDNVVSRSVGEGAETLADELRKQAASASASAETTRSIGRLLDGAGVDARRREGFVSRYLAHDGSTAEFWSSLREDQAFGEAAVERIQLALQLGVLSVNHAPLVKAAQQRHAPKSARDLVRLNRDDWLELIGGQVDGEAVGVPDGVLGDSDDERWLNYAELLVRQFEAAFPTTAVTEAIRRRADPAQKDVLRFLTKNPTFDFERSHITSILVDEGSDLRGISDTEALKSDLKALQRAYRIAPANDRYGAMSALLDAGLDSARRVQRLGRRDFVARYAEALGGEERAQSVYGLARAQASMALAVYARYAAAMQGPQLPVMQALPDADEFTEVPDYSTLFGSLDYCACEDCRSVLSPAAYLVDLLAWLQERDAVDVLLARRPDIGTLELSCENTNTALPYVDLVNEVLENAVAALHGEETVAHDVTTAESDELLANPEYLNRAAYDVLAKATYPFGLPFDLWAAQARIYLKHLGVKRYGLMEAYQREEEPSDLEIAAEVLGLTPLERQLATGNAGEEAWALWGFDAETVENPSGSDGRVEWREALSAVETLLERAGLEFEELLDLLHSDFVNSGRSLGIAWAGSTCDVSAARLVRSDGDSPAADELDRLRRFIRLWRKLGWTVLELDKALTALSAKDLDDDLLLDLAQIQRIRDAIRIELVSLLSWWAALDTKEDRDTADDRVTPLYDRVFLNRAVVEDPEASAFALNEARDEINSDHLGTPLTDYEAELQAALGVDAEDLADAAERVAADLTAATGAETAAGDLELNLDTLSRLYRIVSLAKALGTSVADALRFRGLVGIDPFAGTADALAFLEAVEEVRAPGSTGSTGFSLDELYYLLGHDAEAALRVAPGEDALALMLAEIRTGLQAIREEVILEADPGGELTRQYLTGLVSGDDLDRVMAVVAGTSAQELAEQVSLLETHLGEFLDAAEATGKLVSADGMTVDGGTLAGEERYAYVLAPLVDHLVRIRSENLVTQKLAAAFELEVQAAEDLLEQRLASPSGAAANALAVFLADTFIYGPEETGDEEAAGSASGVDADLNAEDQPDAFAVLTLLDKIATFMDRLEIDFEEQTWLFEHGVALGLLDLTALPLEATSAGDRYAAWKGLVELLTLRDELPGSNPTLVELLDLLASAEGSATALDDFFTQLANRTGWAEEDIGYLADAFGYDAPEDFLDGQALLRLAECFEILGRVGVSGKIAHGWRAADLGSDDAAAILLAAKSRYEKDEWNPIARQLRDALREQQSTALVAYLVAQDHEVEDENDLYGKYLIDVEMSPCMLTSRIKQALASVQLFVQRCFLNLESGIELSSEDAEQWEWMKSYRVWEAARKVFLYPENWLEPDLRDDKSPFFEELEDALLQAEVTDDAVEEAFLQYLERLLEVSRLEIRGLYHQQETDADGTTDILHVFARTPGLPHRYFYRRREDASTWTPWEELETEIEGDHLIPVVHNRRLMLFWPVFTEAADENTPEGEAPEKYWEIQLAWSEYRDGAWSAKKVSEEALTTQALEEWYAKFTSTFLFRTSVEDERLVIRCICAHYGSGTEIGSFTFNDCDQTLEVEESYTSRTLVLPQNATNSYMGFLKPWWMSDAGLYLPAGQLDEDGELLASSVRQIDTLGTTPAKSRIAYPCQYDEFVSQSPFFTEDDRRTFFVAPAKTFVFSKVDSLLSGDRLQPEMLGRIYDAELYQPSLERAPEMELSGIPFYQSAAQSGLKARVVESATAAAASRAGTTLLSRLTQSTGTVTATASTAAVTATATDGASGGAASIASVLSPSSGSVRRRVEPDDAEAQALVLSNAVAVRAETLLRGTHELLFEAGSATTDPALMLSTDLRYRFSVFYHSFTCDFIREVRRHGVDGLLAPDEEGTAAELSRQQLVNPEFFESAYQPVADAVKQPYPYEDIDFEEGGAYAQYNWELFFHAPFLIAERLSDNQRFEEAMAWYHKIFDPMNCNLEYEVPARYWKVKPFLADADDSIQELLLLLAGDAEDAEAESARESLEAQVAAWRDDPFDPHVIAQLRPTAYQKAVVMKYLDNMISWGDYLFRQDTIETINEATQLYVLAAEILGDRPEEVPTTEDVPARSFNDLRDQLDVFSNALVELENLVFSPSSPADASETEPLPSLGEMLYFCIPHNANLLEYWNTVEDRLFKIRNCMNIEGVVRTLPLFEPPIEPGMLVRAVAAGVDLSSALSDLNAPLPHYRFGAMLAKAQALTASVRALGSALLAALEKKDAEALALLRSSHELSVLDAVREVKEQQVVEAKAAREALEESKAAVEARESYYQGLLDEGLLPEEKRQRDFLEAAKWPQLAGQLTSSLAANLALVPDADAGAEGAFSTPVIKFKFGGENLANNLNSAAQAMLAAASLLQTSSSVAEVKAGFLRREEEWTQQVTVAQKELAQLGKQIDAAKAREAIAERDLEAHDRQITNAKAVDLWMKQKFTSKDLYSWMASQISTLYFQSYQLAYDTAKRAERCYRHELAKPDASFVRYGHWDSLKKGLLAGERLQYDLERMEASYLENDAREYEITKHISLALLDPVALIQLRQEGSCYFNVAETVFDLDFPGHYLRRIKSVSLTIPCVAGPYSGLNGTLTLERSTIRASTSASSTETGAGYLRKQELDGDERFRDETGVSGSIVTSSGQNDSGVFEPSFGDPRYLPFERRGVISQWHLALSGAFPQFDPQSISDVIVHLRYTAREGGSALKQAAIDSITEALETVVAGSGETGLMQLFSARHEFPDAWHRFLYPADAATEQVLQLDLDRERFPYLFQDRQIQVGKVSVFLLLDDADEWEDGASLEVGVMWDETDLGKAGLRAETGQWGGHPVAVLETTGAQEPATLTFTVTEEQIAALPSALRTSLTVDGVEHPRLKPEAFNNLAVVVHYSVA
ncbi:MAG: hypothetical protein HY704_00930 [Gemmatimonadetes bacterium]|nr:hypothetical protein [Gemmatimonadota bacterium]